MFSARLILYSCLSTQLSVYCFIEKFSVYMLNFKWIYGNLCFIDILIVLMFISDFYFVGWLFLLKKRWEIILLFYELNVWYDGRKTWEFNYCLLTEYQLIKIFFTCSFDECENFNGEYVWAWLLEIILDVSSQNEIY